MVITDETPVRTPDEVQGDGYDDENNIERYKHLPTLNYYTWLKKTIQLLKD